VLQKVVNNLGSALLVFKAILLKGRQLVGTRDTKRPHVWVQTIGQLHVSTNFVQMAVNVDLTHQLANPHVGACRREKSHFQSFDSGVWDGSVHKSSDALETQTFVV
jgi:hypothetical protein